MTLDTLQAVLGWSSLINFSLLIWWAFFILLAHDWTYKMHSRFFTITKETFDTVHYAGMAFFKLAVLIFNLVPYIALRIIGA